MPPEIHLVKTQPLITTADVTEIWKRNKGVHTKIFEIARLMKQRSSYEPSWPEFELTARTIIKFFETIPEMLDSEFNDLELLANRLNRDFTKVMIPTNFWEEWLTIHENPHPVARVFFHDRCMYRSLANFVELASARRKSFPMPQYQIAALLKRPRSNVRDSIDLLLTKKVIAKTRAAIPKTRAAEYSLDRNWIPLCSENHAT